MVFNYLSDLLNTIHILESTNTSICIIDSDNNIIYESSSKNAKQNIHTNDLKNIHTLFQRYTGTTFRLLLIDDFVTAITTIPIIISDKPYLLEFKQRVKPNICTSSQAHNCDDLAINKIKEMAITDSLTKLYNRRYIDERLPMDMQSSFELDEPLSILFMDIDYFKNINDKNGHAAGDRVLQELALLLQKQIRRGIGWVARYGGDEILICLPSSGKTDANSIANRLRKAIENYKFYFEGKKVMVTCSIGIQTVFKNSSITSITSMSELVAMADRNLYRAKNEGRNRVR